MFKSMPSVFLPTPTSHDQDGSFVESDDPDRSDPAVNSDTLPEDHPIAWLPDARTLYSHGRWPPFVLKKHSAIGRPVVIPTKNGSRPKDEKATIVNLKAKPWDKDGMFWTLDLNHERYIVRHVTGGYFYWDGPRKDFHPKPLALSHTSPSQAGATKSTGGDNSLPEKPARSPSRRKRSIPSDLDNSSESSGSSTPSDSSDVSESEAGKQGARVPAKRRKTEVSSREIDQLYRTSPPARRRSEIQVPIREQWSALAEPTRSSLAETVNREEKRKQAQIARIEKNLDRKFDTIFTPWAGEDQDVSRNTLQMILKVLDLMEDNSPQKIARTLNKALNGGDGKRQPAGGRKPTRPYITALVETLQFNKAEAVSVSRVETPFSLTGSNRQHLDGDLDLDVPSSKILPQRKLVRTLLCVRVASSPEYLPLQLSECMTPRAFYTKILRAWDIRRESVGKITVTFTWMDLKDRMRTMLMNSEVEGCFAHLLEQVDEAPGWEEGEKGKCLLDVDIVLKE